MMNKVKLMLALLRPQQWGKNLFVFVPVFFDRHMADIFYLRATFILFIVLCFMESSVYCFNDIYDADDDAMFPDKRKKLIASGLVSKSIGYVMMVICLILSVFVFFSFRNMFLNLSEVISVLVLYLLMNVAYTIILKQICIVDVFIIAIGYVFRILAACFSTNIYMSHWVVLMTFLLALFLAFSKRREDVVMTEKGSVLIRRGIGKYNVVFVNQAITVTGCITMVCYIMYSVSPEVVSRFDNQYIYLTSIFVLAGIIRFLQIIIVDEKSGGPFVLLMKDGFIKGCVLCWILSFIVILYA